MPLMPLLIPQPLARTCSAAGLGSANVKQPLMAVLKLVHAKARTALAAHAAKRRTHFALEQAEKNRDVSV